MKDIVKKQTVWTACVTPFDATGGTVDYESFERVLRRQESAGNGVLIAGSTGEGLSLQDRERRELVEFTLGLKLSVPVMVGVPSSNFAQSVEWMEFCRHLPISCHLMTTPIYTKPDVLGQTEWFTRLLNLSEAPVMFYNIPSRAGTRLHPKAVQNISSHAMAWSIKDSSGVLDNLVSYQTLAPSIAVYCGDDYMMPAMASEGARGLVSVASNAWPTATRKYVEKCLRGEPMLTKAWWQGSKALFTTSSPVPIKALLHHQGVIAHPTVRLPLNLKDLTSFKELEEAHQMISKWESEHA